MLGRAAEPQARAGDSAGQPRPSTCAALPHGGTSAGTPGIRPPAGRSIRSTGEAFEATVSSQDRARDYLTVGAGILVDLGGPIDVVLDYAGDFFGDGYAAHYGKVSLGWKF